MPVSTSTTIENHLGVCHTITAFQSELVEETTKLDNILRQLRRYYQEVKTKRKSTVKLIVAPFPDLLAF